MGVETNSKVQKKIKISDFVDTYYRIFWNNQNLDRNTFLPQEQLITVNRHIIWAAYKLGMTKGTIRKTVELAGETAKYHIAGDATIQDSVKGMATDYRRQVACRVFHGKGNFGYSAGDPGAAARYTSIQGTPLLAAILKDLPYVPMIIDETGVTQPAWISMPFPMMLVNGCSQVGLGKAAYFCERNVNEVINWIEDNLLNNKNTPIPDPMSSTGCIVYTNPKNGYVVYEAVVKREGKYDIITALPPKVSTYNLLGTLKKKLPKNVASKIIDASGEGNPVYIMVPKGHIIPETLSKYNLQNARKEAHYIWDEKLNTMRMSSFEEVAKLWFESRKKIVTKRLKASIINFEAQIHKINLIKLFVDKEMNKWSIEDIEKELGKEDAEIVLSCQQRVFLPENIDKNEIIREKLNKEIKEIKNNIKNIGQFIINEARDIIKAQEAFFENID